MNLDQAHTIGARTLGPIFTGWSHLLLRAVQRRRLSRLFFLARDGFLLQQVFAAMLEAEDAAQRPGLEYLRLSRRSTLLPARAAIDADGIHAALSVRAGPLTLGSLLEYHGMVEDRYLPVLERIGASPRMRVTSPGQALQILQRAELATLIDEEAASQRAALVDCLVHEHNIGGGSAALVDIGWTGSIQRNLARVFRALPDLVPPAGIYLGLWREDGATSALPEDADGLIGDLRRGRSLDESAPWQAAFLLEAICRADEDSTQCFGMVGGQGTAMLAQARGPARSAEMASSRLAAAVREGILAHVRRHAQEDRWRQTETVALRRQMQDRLLRMAFFPSREEIDLGEHLVHTESHDPHWSSPLILPRPAHPLTAPRDWLAGLASPWRGGYVMATGCAPALLYRRFEALLLGVSPRVRDKLRRLALRLARTPPATP